MATHQRDPERLDSRAQHHQRDPIRAVPGGFSPVQPFDKPGYLDLVVATVGAVIMPWMLFYQQAETVDKGLTRRDLRAARAETFIGAIASEVLMAAVVIAAAAAAASGAAPAIVARGLELPSRLARLAADDGGVLVAIGIVGSGLVAVIVNSRARSVCSGFSRVVSSSSTSGAQSAWSAAAGDIGSGSPQ